MLTLHDLESNVRPRLSGLIPSCAKWLLTGVMGVVLATACWPVFAAAALQEQGTGQSLLFAAAALQEQGAGQSLQGRADQTYREALALVDKDDWAGAIEKLKEAHEIYLRLRDVPGEAKTERSLGWTYFLMGAENKDVALEHLNRSLDLCRSLADREGQGLALVYIGIVHHKTGDTKGALKPFEAALSLLPRSWLSQHGGLVLNMMGDGYYDVGDRQKAITTYKLALRFWAAHEDAGQVAATAEILGTIYLMEGNRGPALEHLELARRSWGEQKNVKREAAVIQSLAILSRDSGDYAEAAFYYDRALSMLQEAKLRPQEVEALNLIGVFYRSLGDPQRALPYHRQALRICADIKDPKAEADTNMHVAQTFRSMGDHLSARGPLQAALNSFKLLDNKDGVASALFYLGIVYEAAGEYQQALDFLQQSLSLARAAKDYAQASYVLRQIGGIYIRLGAREKALENLAEQVSLVEFVTEPRAKASMLFLLGINHSLLRNDRETIKYYGQALEIYRVTGDKERISEALAGMGAAYEFLGDFPQALKLYRESISAREELRTAARLEEAQAGIAGQNASTYQYAARLLMQLGQPEQAFELSERVRARNLLEQLGNARIDPRRGADPQLMQREQSLRAELNALEQQSAGAQPAPHTPEPPARAAQRLDALRGQYEAVLSQLVVSNPEYVSMRKVDPLTLAEVQKLLDKETTLVSYLVTIDKTQVFVITRDSFRAVTLPVGEQSLYETINTFRGFAENQTPHPPASRKLYGWLVEPLRPYLKTRLVGIIPHGVLHYLPFAALTDGRHYFGDEHTLFYLPSASVRPFLRRDRKPGGQTLLSMSQGRAEGAAVLTYADQMASEAAKIFGTTALTGRAATETALRERAGDSGIIILAAHGRLNTTNPLFSRILLAPDKEHDGLLEVHEVYRLDLKQAGLVVLSACQTQLGRRSQGDDIVGLNRAFLYAGAPTVVASLWSVNEQSTSELMVTFLKNLKSGMGKAEALRAAQAQTRAKYPNPYYWAAFVLTGDPGSATPGE